VQRITPPGSHANKPASKRDRSDTRAAPRDGTAATITPAARDDHTPGGSPMETSVEIGKHHPKDPSSP
jgi:hypothetical protein